MIEAKNITIGYDLGRGKKKVIHQNLTFNVNDGEMTALLGANGAGKSTLIKSLSGFTPLLGGEVVINGREIGSYSMSDLSREVGVVLTSRPADGGLTVFDLVSYGRYPYIDRFGTLRSEDIAIIEEAMDDVGISHLSSSYVSQISDGERQKAMIAKVLAQRCQVIILDEPTAFLDVRSRLETYNLLYKIAHEQQKSVLLSTHDLDATLRHADSLIMLSKYHPLIAGNTEDLILSGSVSTLFDGDGVSQVKFDDLDGSFRINRDCNRVVTLLGDDEKVKFWVKNALLKANFDIIEVEKEGVAEIRVNSLDEITINGTARFSSVKELVNHLSKL